MAENNCPHSPGGPYKKSDYRSFIIKMKYASMLEKLSMGYNFIISAVSLGFSSDFYLIVAQLLAY